MKGKRVILDTNLWISFLISKKFKEIDTLIESGRVVFLFSNELLEEFVEVVKRPKFKRYFSGKDIKRLLDAFEEYGELVDVSSDVELCRDKKDNFLLNLSIDGRADFLVTGDQDLLIIEKIGKTRICTFKKWMEYSGEQS